MAAPVVDIRGIIISMTLVAMLLKSFDKNDNRVVNSLSIKQQRGRIYYYRF